MLMIDSTATEAAWTLELHGEIRELAEYLLRPETIRFKPAQGYTRKWARTEQDQLIRLRQISPHDPQMEDADLRIHLRFFDDPSEAHRTYSALDYHLPFVGESMISINEVKKSRIKRYEVHPVGVAELNDLAELLLEVHHADIHSENEKRPESVVS